MVIGLDPETLHLITLIIAEIIRNTVLFEKFSASKLKGGKEII